MRGVTILVPLISACASASGEVAGGEARFDAASPAPLVVPVTEPTYTDAPDGSWRGIYRDYFGRSAKASCAGSGVCHDAAGKPGSVSSNFVCGDLAGCYDSLRKAVPSNPDDGTRPLVDDASLANPDDAYLFKIIRFRDPDGTPNPNRGMPQVPIDYYYSADDITRIKAWMKAGAPND